MAWQTRSPQRILGGNPVSGGVNTGEQQHVRGGSYKVSVSSGGLAPVAIGAPASLTPALGSGNSILFYSGAGRLNSVLLTGQTTSGPGGFLYDAATPAASGATLSAQSVIGVIPSTWPALGIASGGVSNPVVFSAEPSRPDMPFYSGLCLFLPSGNPGITVSWTPDTVPVSPYQ